MHHFFIDRDAEALGKAVVAQESGYRAGLADEAIGRLVNLSSRNPGLAGFAQLLEDLAQKLARFPHQTKLVSRLYRDHALFACTGSTPPPSSLTSWPCTSSTLHSPSTSSTR